MKKFFIAAALVIAAFVGTACNPDAVQCWQITVEFTNGSSATYYYWGDGKQSDAQIDTYAQMPGVKRATKTQAFLSESDCGK